MIFLNQSQPEFPCNLVSKFVDQPSFHCDFTFVNLFAIWKMSHIIIRTTSNIY